MARDCYKVFKSTFAQAKADGLADTVATAAAQSAQADCLSQQSARVPAAQMITVVDGQARDPGPIAGGAKSAHDRAQGLGVLAPNVPD